MPNNQTPQRPPARSIWELLALLALSLAVIGLAWNQSSMRREIERLSRSENVATVDTPNSNTPIQ